MEVLILQLDAAFTEVTANDSASAPLAAALLITAYEAHLQIRGRALIRASVPCHSWMNEYGSDFTFPPHPSPALDRGQAGDEVRGDAERPSSERLGM